MGWQVTAKTVRCKFVGDNATVVIHPDGSAKCTFYSKYISARDGKKKLKNCTGPKCDYVIEFSGWALSH